MRKGTFARLETRQQGRRLFLLSWTAYAAAYVGRYNYSAVMAAITAEGVLSLPAAGAVSTGYFICYAVGQVLCGLLSQRVSPFGMIPAGLLLSAGCNMGMGMAPAGAMPILWAANGLFQAMVWPPIVRLFAECMPLVQQDQACVSINSTTPAGTLAAYALSAAALALAGWRMAFWGCGAVMLAAAVLWMLGTPSLRRAVQSGPAAAPVPAAEKEPSGVRLLPVLAGAGLMGLILPAMLHGGLKDGVTSWVPSMIQSNFGVGPAFAAAVSMALPLVNLTGAYGAGWLDRCVFRNEVKTSAALFAGALVCLLALPAAVKYSLPLSVALLAAGALLWEDPLLAAAARGPLCEETLWDFGPDAAARLAALPAAWPECPSQKLEASGNYMLRSGWQPEDTFIHLRAGRLGGGHGHGDLLHLDVWHGGEAVLVDPGRLTYVDGPRRQALKSPAAHNTLRLDETDFTQYRATWEWENIAQPLPARAHFDPAADYLFAGHGGYLSRGALVERRLVFLKPDLLVGADLICSAGGHQAEAYFHFGQGTLTLNPRNVFWKGSRTCAQLHWLSGQTGCAFESPRAPLYNTLCTGPSLRLTASTSGTTALVWVLSLGGTCDARLVPVTDGAGKPIASRLAQGVRVDKDGQSRTVLFSWQAGPHEAGLLCADGCTGYGTVLAFIPQCPEGLYLD